MNTKAAKAARIAAAAVLVLLLVAVFMWNRCGLSGCPDIDRLNGYVPDRASILRDRTGAEIGRLFMMQRDMVRLKELPKWVPQAFVAMEDKRFWNHHGVDWIRVFGAAYRNIKELGIEEGSSTITMQVARNVFPERLPATQRTMWRKFAEARVARLIEQNYTKNQILELYLNQIYFGNGAYGIQAAADEYFGKPASKLTLAEAATLAALPRAPSRLNPRTNPSLARKGRKVVLGQMASQGVITATQKDKAAQEKLSLRRGVPKTNANAPDFVDAVRREMEDELGDVIYTSGYTIETTLDLKMQRIADEELRRQILAIESGRYGRFRHPTYDHVLADTLTGADGTPYLQAAIVFMDPKTGDVRALVGGRDYIDSQFNRALRAKRQPGSTFKPIVFAAAVADGYLPSIRIVDQPMRLALGGRKSWSPRNEDGIYAGTVTMRQALAVSSNVATVRLALKVGLNRIVAMAHRVGWKGRIPQVPSIVLGSVEQTPLDVTSAYATFATLGVHPETRFVTSVLDAKGKVVWRKRPATNRVLDPAVAFVVTNMLKDVIDRGTAKSVREVGYRGVAAGKTGTSNDAADVWFVGYTPDVVGTIWLGFDRRTSIVPGGKAGELAAPIWGRVMARLGGQSRDWLAPSGVESRLMDGDGNVYASNCRSSAELRPEYFLKGTAPKVTCAAGSRTAAVLSTTVPTGKKEWLKRFLKR
jgi:penicillin-binding protein 1A